MKVHNPIITRKRTPRFKDKKGVKLFLLIAIEAKINVGDHLLSNNYSE